MNQYEPSQHTTHHYLWKVNAPSAHCFQKIISYTHSPHKLNNVLNSKNDYLSSRSRSGQTKI